MTAPSFDCEHALELLQDYLKRELTAELAVRLEAHLERCRPCFQSVEFERRFVALIAARGCSRSAPEAMRERIRAALAGEIPPVA